MKEVGREGGCVRWSNAETALSSLQRVAGDLSGVGKNFDRRAENGWHEKIVRFRNEA